ncbi:MAG TPA: LacI family transcriptional regulator [Erysipelotrichaceae bacterium]|nr:LacI family transcriptional regulator [Erysipelotrichaceae bacterium]
MISIVEIAKMARVSKMTVSNVINKKYDKVSQETRERIEKILAEHNYTPNLFARNLKSNKSKIVLFAIPQTLENDPNKNSTFSNPFYGELINSVEYNLRKSGYFLMLRFITDEEVLNKLIVNWNIDGVVVLGAINREINTVFKNIEVPIVFVDTYAAESGFDTINVEDYKGAYDAVSYLIESGKRKIAMAASSVLEMGVARIRYDGYRSALENNRIEFQENWFFEGFPSSESGEEIGFKIAARKKDFDAVFVFSDMMAIGVMKSLRKNKVKIPEDIAIVGFDGLYIGDLIEPRLSTVKQNIVAKGEKVVEVLLRKVQGHSSEIEQVVLPVELLKKESV